MAREQPTYANTIHIYGMLKKTAVKGQRGYKQYQNPDTMPAGGAPNFTYRVSDEVTIDDVMYYLESMKKVTVAPVDKNGQKLEMAIGMDRQKPVYGPVTPTLNRMQLFKQLDRDVGGIEWKKPQAKRSEE